MAYNNLTELFKATADAIRSKTGGTEPIVANDFPAMIEAIKAGGGSNGLFDGVILKGEDVPTAEPFPLDPGLVYASDKTPTEKDLNTYFDYAVDSGGMWAYMFHYTSLYPPVVIEDSGILFACATDNRNEPILLMAVVPEDMEIDGVKLRKGTYMKTNGGGDFSYTDVMAIWHSGGSSGGVLDTGVMAVVWHSDGNYEQPLGEGVYKVLDIAPSIEQLNNARVLINQEGLGCGTHHLHAETENGMIVLMFPVSDTEMTSACLIVPDGIGMPPEMVGLYVTPTYEGATDYYIMWEP